MSGDPVCGAQLPKGQSIFSSTYNGQTYYFCSVACRNTFRENPRKFARDGILAAIARVAKGSDSGPCSHYRRECFQTRQREQPACFSFPPTMWPAMEKRTIKGM